MTVITKRSMPFPAVMLLLCLLITSSVSAQIRDRESIVQYTVKNPDEVERGKEFQVSVVFSVQPQWYIYAPTGVNAAQGMIETQVVFQLPAGLSRVGKLALPETTIKNGHEIYEGQNIAMTQLIKSSQDLSPGVYEIKGRVTWQTCNSDICLPPITRELMMPIQVR